MSRDFSVPRNQQAALSNAIKLTSRHKYLNACAMWILAKEYEPAINIALQNLDDPHLALLMARLLWQDTDPTKYEEVLERKILPAVSSKFHYNVWERHMILWLLRRPKEAVQALLPTRDGSDGLDGVQGMGQMGDAPELHAVVSYLKDNEIVKSVRAKQAAEEQTKAPESNNNTSANASAAIFYSPLFDMDDMGDFDYATGTFKSSAVTGSGGGDGGGANDAKENDEDFVGKPFEPKAYDLCSKEISERDITDLLRNAAVSYSRCGMLIHGMESVEMVIDRMMKDRERELNSESQNRSSKEMAEMMRRFERGELFCLRQLHSDLMWRFMCVRATVMETSHHIEPEQTKDDFAELSKRFPRFDALSTLNHLYGECVLRGFTVHCCNIPSGPTLTRILVVLCRSISHLSNVIVHRGDRFTILNEIDSIGFMQRWQSVTDDLGLLGKERKIAIAAIAAIAHCAIFLKMFGLNRYDILEDQLFGRFNGSRNALSSDLKSIGEWFNEQRLEDIDFVDDEYKDSLKLLCGSEQDAVGMNSGGVSVDGQWTNEGVAHGPMEVLNFKVFRFLILERFLFLWRKLLKKIGLVTVMFVDLITLHTQLSSWLLAMSGGLQSAFEDALVYCQGSKLNDFELNIQPLTKHNLFGDDPKTESLFQELEMERILEYLVSRMRLFRECHEEKKAEVVRDAYGNVDYSNAVPEWQTKIQYNNDNGWYPPTDVFKAEGALPASVSLNTCNNEWIAVATDGGLREINIDWSLRFRVRDEERSRLMDAECASFSECLLRFQDIESPKHSEIFGPSPFGGSGDQRHAKPFSRIQLNSNGDVKSSQFPVNPLLPRIQLRRSPSFDQSVSTSDPRLSASYRASLSPYSARMSGISPNRQSPLVTASRISSSERLPAMSSNQALFDRRPSDLHFSTFGDDDEKRPSSSSQLQREKELLSRNASLGRQYTVRDAEEVHGTGAGNGNGNEVKEQSAVSLSASDPQPAVTDTLFSTLLFGVSGHSLSIPLWPYCLHIPSIGSKKRALSNTYRFYSRVISQQNKALNADYNDSASPTSRRSNHKELQISEKDVIARNDSYLVMASHPSLPLYLTASPNTGTSSEIRLWHFVHEYPLATFSLPGGSGKYSSSSNGYSYSYSTAMSNKSGRLSRPSRTDSASRSARSLNIKSEKKRISGSSSTHQSPGVAAKSNVYSAPPKASSTADYMTALKFNGFGNKLAGISQNGNLYLWHFNVPRSIFRREFRAYYSQHCHDKVGSDLVFVRGSSCIATAGESSNNYNVCI